LSDIKSFRSAPTTPNITDDEFKKEWKEYVTARKKTPEQKSKQIGFFKFLYYGFTNKDADEVVLKDGETITQKAVKIQRKFFEENPNRTIPNATIFKPLMKSNICAMPVFEIISRSVMVDKSRAKKNI
jgi:hypothetical protein